MERGGFKRLLSPRFLPQPPASRHDFSMKYVHYANENCLRIAQLSRGAAKNRYEMHKTPAFS